MKLTTYTDTQLKATLARLLPDKVFFGVYRDNDYCFQGPDLAWQHHSDDVTDAVLDTELLHLCREAEETLASIDMHKYANHLGDLITQEQPYVIHASWQQRTIALAKVKGLDILNENKE